MPICRDDDIDFKRTQLDSMSSKPKVEQLSLSSLSLSMIEKERDKYLRSFIANGEWNNSSDKILLICERLEGDLASDIVDTCIEEVDQAINAVIELLLCEEFGPSSK
ncbi:hypothetical protein HDU67_003809 [Dinochytrium kinnereticum]|nr:hypothetical protein HDU67_003809 [Dinochytrium kinnereticum]